MTAGRTGILGFGDALLLTGDLDPVYTAIHKAGLDERTRARLVLAYWCFYHLGLAARLAEQKTDAKYWALFREAVENKGFNTDGSKPFPRGAERRHFRGDNALATFQDLTHKYRTPVQAATGMIGGTRETTDNLTFSQVSAAVQSHVGFGPWIAFKIADMAERVLGVPVDFSDCHLGIYKDPRQGAAVALLENYDTIWPGDEAPLPVPEKHWDYAITDDQLRETVNYYVGAFRKFKAPPTGDRPVNVQEVETIFCKYKSHLKGHYPIGKDTNEVGHGLMGWGDLAEQLNQGLNETRDKVYPYWEKRRGT